MPGVARAVLDDAVASLEVNFSAGIEFEKDFPRNDDVKIHGVRGVHARVHGLEDLGEAREFGLEFSERGGEIGKFGEVL